MFGDARHEAHQRARLDEARARHVRHHGVAVAHRRNEARHAEARCAVQFERIDEIGIDAPPDHVGALQARDGAHMGEPVMHDEIVALDQQEAEIARQIGLLEIGLAVRTGRQQADARLRAFGGVGQRGAESAEERREALDVHARDRRSAERATSPADFPAHSRRRTAPARDRRAPTSGRRARGRYRRHRDASSGRPADSRRPAGADIPDCQPPPPPASTPSPTSLLGP